MAIIQPAEQEEDNVVVLGQLVRRRPQTFGLAADTTQLVEENLSILILGMKDQDPCPAQPPNEARAC